jgi:outer membrane protein assembly factor BamE
MDSQTLNLIRLKQQLSLWMRLIIAASLLSGCVYHIDVQQGNRLEQDDIKEVKLGMTRNQVRFILGTPVVSDPFNTNRWDYVYYYRSGRAKTADQRWLVVFFEDNLVSEIKSDLYSQEFDS